MNKFNSLYRLTKVALKYFRITYKKLLVKAKNKIGYRVNFPNTICILLYQGCNLKCKMCGQWRRKATQNQDYLPLSLLKNTFNEIAKYKSEIYLWGGEPTLHPQFADIIHFIKAKDLVCTINTNGTLLKKYAHTIVKAGVDSLDISIDGTENIHDDIRGIKGTFARVIDGLNELVLEAKQQRKKKPLIKAIITISEWNIHNLPQLIHYIDNDSAIDMAIIQLGWFIPTKAGIKYESRLKTDFGVIKNSWKGFENNKTSGLLKKGLVKTLTKIKAKMHTKPVLFFPDLTMSNINDYYTNHSKTFGHKSCLAVNREIHILANGDTSICLDWPDVIIGNIKTETIKQIWHGKKLHYFRENLKKNGLFSVCNRCCALFR